MSYYTANGNSNININNVLHKTAFGGSDDSIFIVNRTCTEVRLVEAVVYHPLERDNIRKLSDLSFASSDNSALSVLEIIFAF